MITWNDLANAQGTNRDAPAACVVDLTQVAVAVEGLPTLRLPAERVTAVHEARHAVLHVAQGTPPRKTPIPADQWRRIVQCCHPDRHGGSVSAVEAPRGVLEHRP